jgi:hypothetical protein
MRVGQALGHDEVGLQERGLASLVEALHRSGGITPCAGVLEESDELLDQRSFVRRERVLMPDS